MSLYRLPSVGIAQDEQRRVAEQDLLRQKVDALTHQFGKIQAFQHQILGFLMNQSVMQRGRAFHDEVTHRDLPH